MTAWASAWRAGALSLLLLLAPGGSAAQSGAAGNIADRVAPCAICHGKEGRASNIGYLPRIAGKPAGYLFNQLTGFRDGRRRQAEMAALLENMTDSALREIADHFAQLELPYPASQPSSATREVMQRGETIALRGDPAKGLRACAECHGTRLTGVAPDVPGLLGLPKDYINGQFGAWRVGVRRAHGEDCMAEVVRTLDPDDYVAVTAWLTAQPVADLVSPIGATGAVARHPPVKCGAAPEPSAPAATASASPEVERGRYLARVGNCVTCHTVRGGKPYAGGAPIETPFGNIHASNLTPDAATGIGAWTADDFWQAMHLGRSKDGRLLYPAFPYPNYTRVTREDADAIFSYLKSLPAVAQRNREHALRFPYNTQWALRIWRAVFFKAEAHRLDERRSPQWNRGAYLVRGLGHCSACHADRNRFGAAREEDELKGGMIVAQSWYAPSLRDAAEAGVADWPEAEIVALLRNGRSAHASVSGPMASVVYASLQDLTPDDMTAMAVYLKSLPAGATRPGMKPNVVDKQDMQRGAKVYEQHCLDCHGKDGRGRAGAYAALAGNRAVLLETPANLIAMVVQGGYLPATHGNPRPYGMPPFGQVLGDADIAAVLTYIRTAWGNSAAPVSTLQVTRARGGSTVR